MARFIDDVQIDKTDFKHLETTKGIKVIPSNEYGDPVRPDPKHTWTAKVGTAQTYIGKYAVKVENTALFVDSAVFLDLNPGHYFLEIWETYTDNEGKETNIYPSPKQQLEFNINENIQDRNNKFVKQLTFQDVVNKAVENAGLNLQVGDIETLKSGEKATVKQEYKDGKNIISFAIPAGKAATVSVGKITTVAPDKQATVTNSGTDTDAKLDFSIPQGKQGNTGPKGSDGATWQPYIAPDGHWHIKRIAGDVGLTQTDLDRIKGYYDDAILNGKW